MNTKNPINIIFIIPKDYLHLLTPYINSISELKKTKNKISIFSKFKINSNNLISNTFFEDINYYQLHQFRYIRLKKDYLNLITKIWNFLTSAFERYYFLFFVKKRITNSIPTIIIATDPISLFIASKLRKKFPFIYFPQELLHTKDVNGFEQNSLKAIEKKHNKHALLNVSFDKQRAKLLAQDNYLIDNSSIIIPNSIPGDAKKRRSTYLRDKFSIPLSKKIILYTGGLANYNLTLETIQSTIYWPKNTVLVMHYFGGEENLLIINKEIEKTGREIYVSNEMLPFKDIKKIYQSADIGLALYGNMTINHRYAGHSSGKMFNFLYNAVPVITNATDLLVESIQNSQCGECILDISDLGSAIDKIILNESKYINGCILTYSTFNFQSHHKKLEAAISALF